MEHFKQEEALELLPGSLSRLKKIETISKEMKKRVKRVSMKAALSGAYSTPLRLSMKYMN